jgi:DNA replication protein DnaC
MSLVSIDFEIEVLNREQKEAKIRNYFKSFGKDSPNFSNFSFTSPSSIADYDLKYISAISLLTEFSSDKEKKGKTKKERSFFFVFLKGDAKKFDYKTLTNELFEVCGFFAKTTMITIVFLFDNESIQVKYSPDSGVFKKTYNNQDNLVLSTLNFVKSPDEYIAKLIDRRKYLMDCYLAFSNNEKNSLPFIENDYLNTREVFYNIIESIKKGKKIIFVEGPAGAGKTILALRLLGFYKNSSLLIINEYFDQELKSIFDEMKEVDTRFFNHRGRNSTDLIALMKKCYENQIPIRQFFDLYTKFIYKKYWKDKNQVGRPEKAFWLTYLNTSRPDYMDDLKEFKTTYLNIQGIKKVEGEHLLIIDEGQRVFNETIVEAIKEKMPTIVFGDLQQKINPSTDNLKINPDEEEEDVIKNDLEQDLLNNLKQDPSFELISMKYPIRISEPALEKIKYMLALTNEKKQISDEDVYPIKIFETCESFVSGFKADKTSQKFICSYQDMWRYEKDPVKSEKSIQKRVTKVSFLSHCVGFEFDDGFNAYPQTNQAYEISNFYGKKLIEMRGMTLDVVLDTSKEKRYRILTNQKQEKLDDKAYYGLSEISRLYPTIKTISKKESENDKNKMLIDPKFKSSIFTPYELISREVRNIYMYLPHFVAIQNDVIIDQGSEGGRFLDRANNTNFLLNQLYVLMTRATNKIFIYCENKQLNSFFKQRLNDYLNLNKDNQGMIFKG